VIRVAALLILIAAPAAAGTCVDVDANGARSYGCLNDSLAHLAERSHAALVTGTLDATSPAQAVGTYNAAAAAEHRAAIDDHRTHPVLPAGPPFPLPSRR